MKLNIPSVAGSALNFGARKMETIMRLAWLPVALILILQIVTTYLYLSVAAGRFVSAADFATLGAAQSALAGIVRAAWIAKPALMAIATVSVALINLLLVSSFMAPLIRFAGLGERPPGGAMRLDFGPSQARYVAATIAGFLVLAAFVYLPIASAAYYTMKYISQALQETLHVSFPDPQSLHTIDPVSRGDALIKSEKLNDYVSNRALLVAAPFALLWWAALIAHFHPKNREDGGRPNFLLRALATLIGGATVIGFFWLCAATLLGFYYIALDPAAAAQAAEGKAFEVIAAKGGAAAVFWWRLIVIAGLALAIFYYVNLRLTPWPGVAVCRGSMAPAGMLSVTRGFNIVRLIAAIALLSVVIFLIQLALNAIAIPALAMTLGALWQATDAASKLANSGEAAAWIPAFFTWTWQLLKILVNVFWTFFTYGVTAGFLGRLYRESER